tara:strand:- start:13589 stop:14704 length:1116 start_codon:yes stop_codon:yes gene_type:complete
MSEKRYLKESDYKKSIFLSQLDQLTQGDESTLLDAELDAKACITSMLTDEYEIEKEYELGEGISDLHTQKEYFKDDYVTVDGRLSKAKAYVSGSKPPLSDTYWRLMDISEIDEETIFEVYNQDIAFYEDDIVLYGELYFECLISNGVSVEYGEENIIPPHTTVYWQPTTRETWDVATDYSVYDATTSLVGENDVEYALIDPSKAVVGTSPSNDTVDAWLEVNVQYYDRTERYVRPEGFDGYVVLGVDSFFVSEEDEGSVNGYIADEEKFIFSPAADPRNRNIVSIMVHLVIHQLCSVVVPDNLPTVRIANKEAAMKKLDAFSKMKANPAIDRKCFTITTKNPITGVETESVHKSSRWAVNSSENTRDNWSF